MRTLAALLLVFTAVNARAADWVEKTLHAMTREQKIGQLLIPSAPTGGFRGSGSEELAKLRATIADYHLGGYHVLGGDPAGTAMLIHDLQSASAIPLLITADLEGGAGYVLFGATRLPLGMAIGATGSEELAAAAGRIAAIEGRTIGVHVQFYPVVDVQNNPRNPIINIRSFGEDPRRVAALTTAYLRAVQANGMLATAKHFPGHGDVATDSHLGMPILDVDRARLDAIELPPFRSAIDAGVAAVMSAHIHLPKIEPVKDLPSTLSKTVLTGLLRDELGFKGLIFTDAMDMRGITAQFDEAEATVRAVEAGADVILFPPKVDVSFNALRDALASGRLTESRIDDSVRRILRAKQRLGLDHYKPADLNGLSAVVGSKEHREIAQRISEAALTLVRDERGSLPLEPSADKRVLHVVVLDSRRGWREGPVGNVVSAEIQKRFPKATTVQIDDQTTRNEFAMLRQSAEIVDAVIVSAFIRVAAYKGSIDLTRDQLALLRDLAKIEKPFVFTLFGSPYLLDTIPELPSYILTYDTHPDAERAAARAITGEIPFTGKLPVSLPGLYPIGHSQPARR
jgi:beta-N-acetylhexosaminidase